MELLIDTGAVLYDDERNLNVLRELVSQGLKEIAKAVLRELLGTVDLIPVCEECLKFTHDWVEYMESILLVDIMPKTGLLLAHVVALGAQNSLDMMLEGNIESSGVNNDEFEALQAAAYFQKYDVLVRLLERSREAKSILSEGNPLIRTVLEGIMPTEGSAKDAIASIAGQLLLRLSCRS